jgi:hypothetical protein
MTSSPELNLEDVIAVIRAQHSSLPTSQQKVAEFLLGHGLDSPVPGVQGIPGTAGCPKKAVDAAGTSITTAANRIAAVAR